MRSSDRHSSERGGCRGVIKICVLVAVFVISGYLVQYQERAAPHIQTIEITDSALQHVINRHTVGGSENAGKSVFNQGEDLRDLIKNAESVPPVAQARGNCERIVDAGRPIGIDRSTDSATNIYTVITTESGKLVTMFPGRP